MPHYRIVFRSDTRPPKKKRKGYVYGKGGWKDIGWVGSLFETGFQHFRPLKPWRKIEKAYRARPKTGEAGDMGAGVVCLSQRVSGAALFPYGNGFVQDADGFINKRASLANTWMYVALLKEGTYFSTHNRQIMDGWNRAQHDPKRGWWPIYAHEIAAKKVPAENVVAAVYCTRTKLGAYTLVGPVLWNDKAVKIPEEYRVAIEKFLETEVKLGTQPRAQPSSGYRKSSESFLIDYLVGYGAWKAKTARAWHTRSADLVNVDKALEAFAQSRSPGDWERLKKDFKTWYDNNEKERTKRNVDDVVENLRKLLKV